MIIRSIDGLGDWQFGKGKNDYVSNNKAIIQNIATRLRSFLGDCFFATDAGLDWFNLLGSKNQLALELAVRTVILNTAGVTSLVDVTIELDHTTRHILMQYTVETVYTGVALTPAVVGGTTLLLTQSGDVLTTESGQPLITG